MKYKISVIVPVYKVEKYIRRCIESILKQDFTDYELILVNDGSPDNSPTICKEYAKKHKNIVLINQKNQGLSKARNTGMDNAQGEYILFLDSDDYIEQGMFKHLVYLAEKHKADIVSSHHKDDYDGKIVVKDSFDDFECTGLEAAKYVLEGKKIPGTACAKLIKKECIGDLKFQVGKIYEDAFFIPELFLKVKKVYVSSEQFYVYYHRKNSTTTAKFTDKNYDVIDAYEYNIKLIEKEAPQLYDVARFRILWAHCIVYDKLIFEGDRKSEKLRMKKILKSEVMEIVSCKYFSKFRRLSMLIFKINSWVYDQIVKYQNRRRGLNE